MVRIWHQSVESIIRSLFAIAPGSGWVDRNSYHLFYRSAPDWLRSIANDLDRSELLSRISIALSIVKGTHHASPTTIQNMGINHGSFDIFVSEVDDQLRLGKVDIFHPELHTFAKTQPATVE
jgi:hypothetical protein